MHSRMDQVKFVEDWLNRPYPLEQARQQRPYILECTDE